MTASPKLIIIFELCQITFPVMKIIRYFAIFLILASGGCNNSDDEIPDSTGTTVELNPLGDLAYGADIYSCSKDCYSKLLVKMDTGCVIKNDDDYTKFKIRANCLEVTEWPAVDFTKNTLLAGNIITNTSCCVIIKIDFTKDLSLPMYSFIVTLQPGQSSTPPGAVFYWGVTPKLPDDASVVFVYKYYSIQ